MKSNGQRKSFLVSTLFLASAMLLLPVVSRAQTAGTTITSKTMPASYDPSAAIEVAVGEGPTGIAFDGASIWVTNQFSNSVIKVSNNGAVVGRYAVGKNPTGIAADGTTVWVVYPETREVEVHAPGQTTQILGIDATLDGGDILPGFSLAVKDVFPEQLPEPAG